MKTKSSIIKKILYIIIPLVIILLMVVRLKSNKEIAEQKIYQYDKEQTINIQTDTLEMEFLNEKYSYSGTFEPYRETKISADIQGKINEVLVDVGSYVTRGQFIVQLDNSLLGLQLESIEIQIEGLQADINRYTILANAEAIQGVQLEKSELGLKSALVQKATLLEQINKTTIVAPFNGLVTAKLCEEGAFAAPGVPLIQITDISNLKFTINISENYLSQFTLHQSYLITGDAYPELSLTGKVSMIGSKANMGSSFPVQFIVKNTSDLKIKSGMFGKVFLNNNTEEMGIIIPTSIITGTSDQKQVYLVRDGKAVLKSISVSKIIQSKAVISEGLSAGDVIVSNGLIELFDGANVIVK